MARIPDLPASLCGRGIAEQCKSSTGARHANVKAAAEPSAASNRFAGFDAMP